MTQHSPMEPTKVDVAVIGAGPAGMAAAVTVSKAGLSVALLDEGQSLGGQIYRNIENGTRFRDGILGSDYVAGRTLAQSLRASDVTYLPRTTVWNISTDNMLDLSRDGSSSQLIADKIIVATGAVERPSPMPGWTLAGVTTVGALQILLKASGVVQEDAVLVGSGPLMWLVAAQMISAGTPPKAIVETTPKGRMAQAMPHILQALKGHRYLTKGLSMMRQVRGAGIPIYNAATNVRINGGEVAESVTFISKGKEHTIHSNHIALHQGVVPNQQVTRLLRCDHKWDASQHCFRPVLDGQGKTSVPDVYVAGDGAGIGGAKSAALMGRLVALAIAEAKGKALPERLDRLEAALASDGAIRPFLEAMYAPAPQFVKPAKETIVCRCEEVTAGAIEEAVDLGAPGPNQVKSFLRSGMGPCQGRVCGLVVSSIIAERRKASMDETGYYRIRPPLKPIPLSELANFQPLEVAQK